MRNTIETIIETIGVLLLVIGVAIIVIVSVSWIDYTLDSDTEEFVYTYPLTYPELIPLSKELDKKIQKEGHLSAWDKYQFHKKVREIQNLPKYKLTREASKYKRVLEGMKLLENTI